MHMEIRKADGGPRRGGTGNEGLYGGARRENALDSVWDDSLAATYHAVENTILEQTT